MTTCYIRQETDLHPKLTEQIGPISATVAPLVEEMTGLSLGHMPVIRVVDHEDFIAATMAERRRVYALDATQLALSSEATRALHDRVEIEEAELRRSWMGGGAATVTDAEGVPQVLIAPESFHHAGFGTDVIVKALAHEFAHVAQHRASSGQVVIAYNTGRPDLRGLGEVAVAHLLHGHAEWVDQRVTERVLGHVVELGPSGRETPEFLAMMREFSERMRVPENAPAHPAMSPEVYEEGLRWVTHAIGLLGVATLNQVWCDFTLAPDVREIKDVNRWAQRLDQGIPSLESAQGNA
ncbi:hypothetical protein SMD44_p20041 (plasmid) [Streptomyces alboflavus]|uniref:Uncharacterized protein n=1 Tax=Streptomyces alboflavus TaxID=67267 RepID=A0A291W4A2_9ACTN|nr:hypothetical protein [Streptomyces alboflavus]ATM24824.1 hypothetical protein SMD44_p20041 [Streptomyces alboflavus]